jgi:hypothetical protein
VSHKDRVLSVQPLPVAGLPRAGAWLSRKRVLAYAAVAVLGFQGELAGQATPVLTQEDSVSLRLSAIKVLLDSLHLGTDVPRLWFQPHQTIIPVPAPQATRDMVYPQGPVLELGAAERQAIIAAYPQSRFVALTDQLYVCRQSDTLQIPGGGCPIRDRGVVIALGPLQHRGDSIFAVANVRYTYARHDSGNRPEALFPLEVGRVIRTRSRIAGMLLRREEGGWQLHRISWGGA